MKSHHLHIAPYNCDADILAAALVSDKPEIMCLHQLPQAQQQFIEAARLRGGHPVSVRWPGGQFAIMFCEPGTNMPSVANVLRAYRGCVNTSKQFPEGETVAALRNNRGI